MKIPTLRTESQKVTKTITDTVEFTREEAEAWALPVIQRERQITPKVRALADQISCDSGVLPGMLLFGVLNGKIYLIDGQHRREAFMLSGKEVGYADVRIRFFASMAEMGEAYVKENGCLVTWRPDDSLRALELSTESLQLIRAGCPFVGYDKVRRGSNGPMLSMSTVLRCWKGSEFDVPASGMNAATVAKDMRRDETNQMIGFLACAMSAWGRDPEFQRLWGRLNLTVCMWLYRRVVLGEKLSGKATKMSLQAFKNAATALSADGGYLEWLVGRGLTDRDRAPAYRRMTAVMAKRMVIDGIKKPMFPAPPWSLGQKATRGRR